MLRHMTLPTGRPRGLTPDGPEIRRLRVGLGLTVTELAVQIGYHPKSLSRAECQGKRISDVTASRIARALGVAVEDIASRGDDDDDESDAETKIPA